jgi:pimeloyl-ACP methyl ester carboxylesterase
MQPWVQELAKHGVESVSIDLPRGKAENAIYRFRDALSGESDPFATVELLRTEAANLKQVELVTYPGVGHGLLPVAGDAASRIAAFLRRVSPKST